ncbi:pilus assembly protein PilP [Legionella lytica]|uniref:Pilus assembly protein PilP n=1 Tax=Legionella lytica TaxID=96232 RepID=A0ABW8D6B7_9GAMM
MTHKSQILLCICPLLLAACSNDNRDLARYIQQVKAQKHGVVPANPSFKKEPLFKFPNVMMQRSPFKPTDRQKPAVQSGTKYFEEHPVHSLKLVGVLMQGSRRLGLIAGPDAALTQVHVGDYLGKEGGRIVAISIDAISLEKSIKSSSGVREKHTTSLKVYREKQE